MPHLGRAKEELGSDTYFLAGSSQSASMDVALQEPLQILFLKPGPSADPRQARMGQRVVIMVGKPVAK